LSRSAPHQPVELWGTSPTGDTILVRVGADGRLETTLVEQAVNRVMLTAVLTTTTLTVDQAILSHVVPVGKTFYLVYLGFQAVQTTLPGNANPVQLGILSLENPPGAKLITDRVIFGSAGYGRRDYSFAEPLPFTDTFRVVCTPASTLSIEWRVNLGGFEK